MITLFILFFSFFSVFPLVKELDNASRQVSKLQDSVDILKKAIQIETEAINDIESRIKHLEQQIMLNNKLARERFVLVLKYSSKNRFVNLINDAENFFREEAILAKLLKDNLLFYEKVILEIGVLNDLRVLLDSERIKFEKSSIKLAEKLKELEEKIEIKKALLNKIKKSPSGYIVLQKGLKDSSEVLFDIAGTQQAKKPFTKGFMSQLLRPVQGSLFGKFGKVWDIKLKNWKNNTGIIVKSPYGSEVFCVAEGVVKFSGWIIGFGKVLIVQHDDTWVSIYAHLGRILFELGEKVKKGEIVAYVGDSGNLDFSALFFSIRHGDKNIDPTPLFID